MFIFRKVRDQNKLNFIDFIVRESLQRIELLLTDCVAAIALQTKSLSLYYARKYRLLAKRNKTH